MAVLPARLRMEMQQVREALLQGAEDISHIESVAKHGAWYRHIRSAHESITEKNVEEILKQEIGKVFMQVLTHAGVFKRDEQGMAAFDRFVESVSLR